MASMPIKPADPETKNAIANILSKFLSEHSKLKGELGVLHGKINDKYQGLSPLLPHQLIGILRDSSGVEMKEHKLVLYLDPIEKERILPLITIQSDHDWVHFRVYALLAKLNDAANLKSLAIRFETDEGDYKETGPKGAHDFCHAQLCNTISESIPVYAPEWLPDSQPSFPLDADDQVTLVLCMLVSLYGSREVRAKLNGPGIKNLEVHLNRVQALKNPVPNKPLSSV